MGAERNYTIVSAIPAVSAGAICWRRRPGSREPLPDGYEIHLQLPDTITDRTRQLAAEFTDNQPSAFAKAHAIEAHLLTVAYDLTVPEPNRRKMWGCGRLLLVRLAAWLL